MREGTTVLSELERVLEGSWLSIIILTPDFIEHCLPRYLSLAFFQDAMTSQHDSNTCQLSGRIMAVAVGISEDDAKRILPSCKCVCLKDEWKKDFQSWEQIEYLVGNFGMSSIGFDMLFHIFSYFLNYFIPINLFFLSKLHTYS